MMIPENEVETLLKTKAEMEVKLKEAQKKLMQQKMDNKARRFQDHIAGGIRDFRVVIMDCFDSSRLDERLVRARETFRDVIATVSCMGYTFKVGDKFLDRVEESINSGQMPEQQFKCTKIDNSQEDPVCGEVTDVIYEVTMPVIVKREACELDSDEDLQIISVQPPTQGFFREVTVKQEKVDDIPRQHDNDELHEQEKEQEKKEQDSVPSEQAATKDNSLSPQGKPEEEEDIADEDIDVVTSQTPKRKGKQRAQKRLPETLPVEKNLRSRVNKP